MKLRGLFRSKRPSAPEPATPVATAALPISTARIDEMVQKAQTLLGAGRLPEAAEAFIAVLALDPENWTSLGALGSIALQRGALPEAIERYSALIERRPDFAEGYYERGN